MRLSCVQCGEPFEALRSTAKYCGERCKKQFQRRRAEGANASTAAVSVVLEATERELRRLGKFDTVLGQSAIVMAGRLASSKDTGSSTAAVSRELDRLMSRVAAGEAAGEDQVSAARRRRDAKRAQAREAAQSTPGGDA